jgi:FMN reductase
MIEEKAMTVIVGLGGTLRASSYSRMGVEVALAMAEQQGAETHLLDVKALDLPMYDADLEISDYPQPRLIVDFLELHRRADVFLWSCPSYHGTVTGSFKNAIDFIEFLADDERPYLTGRAVGLIAVNDIPPVDTMRTIARELRAWASPSTVVLKKTDFAADGSIQNEVALRRLNRVVTELLGFCR